jgi:hypothetical protein
MANYGYVKVPKGTRGTKGTKGTKAIDPYAFIKALHEINARRFKGLLKIEPMTDEPHGWYVSFQVNVSSGGDGIWYVVGRQLWLNKSRRMVTQPHGAANYLDGWVDWVFLNELGEGFSGIIADDGVAETWEPKSGKYPTLAKYMMRMLKPLTGRERSPEMRKAILDHLREDIACFKKHLPVEWVPLLGADKLPKA